MLYILTNFSLQKIKTMLQNLKQLQYGVIYTSSFDALLACLAENYEARNQAYLPCFGDIKINFEPYTTIFFFFPHY